MDPTLLLHAGFPIGCGGGGEGGFWGTGDWWDRRGGGGGEEVSFTHYFPDFKSMPKVHCNENSIYVFLFWELRGLSPNFHIMCL